MKFNISKKEKKGNNCIKKKLRYQASKGGIVVLLIKIDYVTEALKLIDSRVIKGDSIY